MKSIERLKGKKPKEFWKLFSKARTQTSQNISVDSFHDYFKNLIEEINVVRNEDAENFCDNNNFDNDDPVFAELDAVITESEVQSCIKSLKREKSCGSDNILNEYFIETGDILLSHLTELFNLILETGYFPDSWADGIIIPLFKKGDQTDVRNYRGITLVSCLSKLFTSVLNNRIVKWCDENSKISDAQFGFRKGFSTVDAIYTLHSLIENMINNNKRFYCAFVDMKKAFDSIYRNALWLKLFKMGINGKMLRILKGMYESVRCRVRHLNTYADFFEVAVGLKQGETMSPVLFSLFVEDLEIYLQSKPDSGINVNDINLILLFFADDMVVLGETPYDLQNSLDRLYQYCLTWGLEVNTIKTKCIVFRRRGGLLNNEKWYYNDIEIETVNDFNYLGVVFNYTGTFVLNQQYVSGKALKAMGVLMQNIRKYDFSPKSLCQLFDSFVTSVLNYACEVWGYTKSKQLERLHLKFCKKILKVKLSTSNAGVYGELGRYPLYVCRFTRLIKYWIKVINTENCVLQSAYSMSLDGCIAGKRNWAYNVRTLLYTHGFGYVREDPSLVNPNTFLIMFKQRLIDTFVQQWSVDVANNNVLCLYKHFKINFEYEYYLDCCKYRKFRETLTQLRLSSHQLRIETGRHGQRRIDRSERKCQICNSDDLEDEYHFVLICAAYTDLRLKYIPVYYRHRPSVDKFIRLMNTLKPRLIRNLSYYVYYAFEKRKNFIMT